MLFKRFVKPTIWTFYSVVLVYFCGTIGSIRLYNKWIIHPGILLVNLSWAPDQPTKCEHWTATPTENPFNLQFTAETCNCTLYTDTSTCSSVFLFSLIRPSFCWKNCCFYNLISLLRSIFCSVCLFRLLLTWSKSFKLISL